MNGIGARRRQPGTATVDMVAMETLASWIAEEGRLPVADSVGWVVRLAKALEPIHGLGIAHGRVSAEAILSSGAGCHHDAALVGTKDLSDDVSHRCPARAKGKPGTPASDTWAAVVLLYEMLTGTRPFEAESNQQLLKKIGGLGPAPLSRFDVKNDKLQRLIDRAFSPSPKRRLTTLRDLQAELTACVPAASELPPLQLGSGTAAPKTVEDEVYEAETQKLDDVQALTRLALIKKGAIPAVPIEQMSANYTLADHSATEEVARDAGAASAAPPSAADPAPAGDRSLPLDEDEEDQAATRLIEGDAAVEVSAQISAAIAAAEHPPLVDEDSDEATRLIDPIMPPPRARPPVELPPPSRPPPLPARNKPKPAAVAEGPSGRERTAAASSAEEEPNFPHSDKVIDFGDLRAHGDPQGAAGGPGGVVDAAALGAGRPAPAVAPSQADRLAAKPPSSAAAPAPTPAAKAAGGGASPSALASGRAPQAPAIAAAQQAAAVPAARPAPPKARRRSPLRSFIRLLLLAVVGAAVALLVFRPDARRDFVGFVHRHTGVWIPLPGVPAAPNATGPATSLPAVEPTAAAGPDATARGEGAASPATAAASAAVSSSAAGSARPTDSAAPSAAPAPSPADAQQCVVSLFPPHTFASIEPKFDFLCTQTNPRKGANALKTQIVLAGGEGAATVAMQEWALLGWYEMAAFAIVRARCCGEREPLTTPKSLSHCKLDDALAKLETSTISAEDSAVGDAVRAYSSALHCLHQVGAASVFGLTGSPRGGSASAFEKMMTRVRQVGGP